MQYAHLMLALQAFNRIEDHVDTPRYHPAIRSTGLVVSSALYCVRLTAIADTIAEHQSALALEGLFHQWQSSCLEECILRSRRAKDLVERVDLRRFRRLIGS